MRDGGVLSVHVLEAPLSRYTSAVLGGCREGLEGCARGLVGVVKLSGAHVERAPPDPANECGAAAPSERCGTSVELLLGSEEMVDLAGLECSGGVHELVSGVVALRDSMVTSGVDPMLLM